MTYREDILTWLEEMRLIIQKTAANPKTRPETRDLAREALDGVKTTIRTLKSENEGDRQKAYLGVVQMLGFEQVTFDLEEEMGEGIPL